jgi:mono/diheme cytochrome c family protein
MRIKHLTAGAAVLAAVGVWRVGATQEPDAKPKGDPGAAELRERGAYLVNSAILCADCHTPQDDRGQPDRARQLRGASLTILPKKETKNWADMAPDITSLGLTSEWGEEKMIKFLTTGVDPDSRKARPPMPAFRLNAGDARAVYQYLRSLPGGQRGEGKRPE